MLTGIKQTLPTHPALLMLQEVLTAAERGAPAQPVRTDFNEQRAAQLISRIQAGYRKTIPFLNMAEVPNVQAPGLRVVLPELVEAHA